MMVDFAHLHVHSEFSLLDGLSSVKQITESVASMEMDSVGLTDHGTMFGIFKFYAAAKALGIKPIIGVEAYVAPRSRFDKMTKIDDEPYHLILLAKDRQGYQNLIKLISLANLEGYYYKPRIDRELIEMYHDGLIASSACLAGEIPRYLYAKRFKEAKETAIWYEKTFGKGNFYLEIQPNRLSEQKIVNKRMIELSRETGIPLIATTDSHYPTAKDSFAQDVLVAINTKKTIADKDRLSMADAPDFYLWGEKEMLDYFSGIEEAVKNTKIIKELCNVDIENHEWILPKSYVPSEYFDDKNKYLWDLSYQRAQKRLGRSLNEIEKERIEYELKIIIEKGFSQYMLMVSEFTDWMRERDLPFTTRGSAAGSFVAFSLGIVNANPLDFNLAFERFLNPLRPKAPDIDLDVASNVRDDLIEYTIKKHGKENVAHIVTFGRMQARGSIRDAGRVLGLPLDYVDKIAKLIPPSGQGLAKVTIQKAVDMVAELKTLMDQDPDAKQLVEVAQKIEGKARNIGMHACGILVTPTPIIDYVPVIVDKDSGRMITQYEMDALEELKLIKVDFLGLTNLETIRESIRLISNSKKEEIDLSKIKYDDPLVFKTINNLDTLGVFQLESDVMKQTIKTIKPATIFDLSAVNALVRPGPNQFQKEYALRKEGKKPIEYLDPRMEKFLKLSFGVLVYQEDIIRAVIELAGMDWGEADKVRKATGKKKPDVLFEMKDELITRFKDHGMSEENANKLFEQFIPFTNYAFNQAHAAAYAIVIYYTAWLKTYYPVEFLGALLKTDIEDKDKVTHVLDECFRKGINILPPSINKSDVEFKIENGSIRIGLNVIKGINRKALSSIINKRDNENILFESIDHFLDEIDLEQVPIKSIELLIMAGAFDEFGDRSGLLDILPNLYKKYKDKQLHNSLGQNGLFTSKKDLQKLKPVATALPNTVNCSASQKINWEKELIGIFISEHPLKKANGFMNHFGIQTTKALNTDNINKKITILGTIQKVKKISTKKGDSMAFVKLEDLDGFAEVVVFPNVYHKVKDILIESNIIVVKGIVNERNDEFTLLADRIKQISNEHIDKYNEDNKGFDLNKNEVPRDNGNSLNIHNAICYRIENSSITFYIPGNTTPRTLEKLKDLIRENPGESKVFIEFDCDGNKVCKEIKQRVSLGSWLKEINYKT